MENGKDDQLSQLLHKLVQFVVNNGDDIYCALQYFDYNCNNKLTTTRTTTLAIDKYFDFIELYGKKAINILDSLMTMTRCRIFNVSNIGVKWIKKELFATITNK